MNNNLPHVVWCHPGSANAPSYIVDRCDNKAEADKSRDLFMGLRWQSTTHYTVGYIDDSPLLKPSIDE